MMHSQIDNTKLDNLRKQISQVPQKPGVYLWKDKDGCVIYVGKAKQLRSRMRQYINFQDERAKIPMLVDSIESFEYVVVKNETESLILEKQFIEKYKPYFNADFKDDKSYPFIALTTGNVFPAIKYTREKHKNDTIYFGPYTDSKAARKMVDVIRRIQPICITSCATWRSLNRQLERAKCDEEVEKIIQELKNKKPCFDCHVGLGPGVCCGQIEPKKYSDNIKAVRRFLSGQQNEFLFDLQTKMHQAADSLDFETASRYKSRIEIINANSSSQTIFTTQNIDADIIGVFCEADISGVYVLVMREGRIINSNEFVLDRGNEIPINILLNNFLIKYYTTATQIPKQIIVQNLPEDVDVMEEWLTEVYASSHGAQVKFVVPEKGERAQLLKLANQNAKHALLRYKVKNNYDDKRINNALLQLESALSMESSPMRIECFDISTIHGSYTVASMVVFTGGKSDKSQYRRFKIKTPLDEANDFLSMQEVLSRRYRNKKMQDSKFAKCPNLILLDGGKPQLSASIKTFEAIGFDWQAAGVTLAGLAKSDEEIIVPLLQNEDPSFNKIDADVCKATNSLSNIDRPLQNIKQTQQDSQSFLCNTEISNEILDRPLQNHDVSHQILDRPLQNNYELDNDFKKSHTNVRQNLEFETIRLPDGSESLNLVKQVRDEAHRFAITYHRELRDKAMTRSVFDTVPGIGKVRKKKLLNHFGSIKKLRAASLEEIIDSKILPLDVAKELYFIISLSG